MARTRGVETTLTLGVGSLQKTIVVIVAAGGSIVRDPGDPCVGRMVSRRIQKTTCPGS